jgi:hypothetical protein
VTSWAGGLRRPVKNGVSIQVWRRAAAPLMVRIVVSFLLNPTSCIELSDDEAVRSFARRFLAPLLQC